VNNRNGERKERRTERTANRKNGVQKERRTTETTNNRNDERQKRRTARRRDQLWIRPFVIRLFSFVVRTPVYHAFKVAGVRQVRDDAAGRRRELPVSGFLRRRAVGGTTGTANNRNCE
jgi:hypothetical protein